MKDSTEFKGLLKMDPYLNIKPGQSYPATLIMPSYNDDRIPIWDSGKYVGKLQKMTSVHSPVLLDIDYEFGHNKYAKYDEVVRLYSKIFSFARSNLKK